jgi:hypothetical protein
MKPAAQKAFNELKKIGAPVIDRNDEGHFIISAEDNTDEVIWADYYDGNQMSYCDDFGVNKKITAILDKHGLFAEWVNPGFLSVHTA